MNGSYRTIIVFSYGAIGDFVMLLYFLASLHGQRREPTRYAVLTTARAALLREMAAAYPFVEIISVSPAPLLRLFAESGLRRNLVVIPPSFVAVPFFMRRLARLFALRGALAGFSGRARGPRYAVSVSFEPQAPMHENFARLLAALGYATPEPPRLEFLEDASRMAALGGGYVVVAPFASNPGKTLPRARWETLLAFLQKRYPGRAIAMVGGPADAEAAGHFAARYPDAVQNCCAVPFAQLAALLRHASCFVGVDSGLTHVAGVMRVPSVIIDNLRAVTWLPTYNPRAVILTESKHCRCGGDKTGDCNYVIDGVSYLRCMYDVSDERIRAAIAATLA